MEHLLFLFVGDSSLRLELIRSCNPSLIVTSGGIVGVDAVAHRGAGHKLRGVGAHAVIVHSAGVVPGDVAAALLRRPAVAPHHIERGTNHVPGVPILGVQVSDHAARKFHQGKAQKCSFWVNGPGHVGGVGFLSAGAAGVVSSNISSGCDIRRSPAGLGCLGREHTQGDAGVRTVSRGNFIGQLVG